MLLISHEVQPGDISLPFKGRAGVGMGGWMPQRPPIPLLTSPLPHGIPSLRDIKGEELALLVVG
jgi:hypothetical protein